jgi:hypothetical protein
MPSSYCYAPIVQGGLLTHGHGGINVGEEDSSDGFPLRQSTETGLQIEFAPNREMVAAENS